MLQVYNLHATLSFFPLKKKKKKNSYQIFPDMAYLLQLKT